jgi:tetratricopeptide (TPR) repeat protein
MCVTAVLTTPPPEKYSPQLLADYQVAAMAALGNAKRLAGFFAEAKAALRTAWEYLKRGTGNPLEEANVISIEASLYRNLGQFEQVAATLQRAVEIYRKLGGENRRASILPSPRFLPKSPRYLVNNFLKLTWVPARLPIRPAQRRSQHSSITRNYRKPGGDLLWFRLGHTGSDQKAE